MKANLSRIVIFSLLAASVAAMPCVSFAKDTPEKPAAQAQQQAQPGVPSKAALEAYNQGLHLFQLAQIQADKGDKAAREKLLKKSEAQYREALKLDPKFIQAQSSLGYVWLTMEKYDKAIEQFQQALKMDDKHLNTLNGLATAYAFANRIDESVATFDKLTTLDPGNALYAYNKGSVLQKAGRPKEALEAYELALKIDPNHQRALFNAGTLLENQGKLTEAVDYYKKAKGADVGNLIGLDAINRLEAIDAYLKEKAAKEENTGEVDSDGP